MCRLASQGGQILSYQVFRPLRIFNSPGCKSRCCHMNTFAMPIWVPSSDRNQSTRCQLCQALSPTHPAPEENMVHVLTRCRATADVRTRITPELHNIVHKHIPAKHILQNQNHTLLTQLILDPISLNLPMSIRVSPNHPALMKVITVCRKLCYSINREE